MPKKFKGGENSKAVDARARKAAVQEEEQLKKKKQVEDAYWQDDDKHIARKEHRKEDKERKRQEQLEKKREKQALFEEDMEASKPPAKPSAPAKLTRAQILTQQEQQHVEAAAAKKKDEIPYDERPIEENINRLMDDDGARTVDEALSVLSVKEPEVDTNPEKRMKAAFTDFQARNLERIKAENPTLRLSQVKQLLKKEWMKSSDNPMNQRKIKH